MTDAEHTESTPRSELRIALAMRGGVSLAVWIGGVLAELDLARRGMLGEQALAGIPPGDARRGRALTYAALFRDRGYDALTIDVLAGASAGGLNAVIYGYAQSTGVDVEWLGDVWEDRGELWKLFHPAWRPGEPFRTEALLQGDGDTGFHGVLRSELARRTASSPPLCVQHLTVDLAATLQSGPPLPSPTTGEDVRPRTAHFRFRRTPAPYGVLNDIGSAGDPDADRARARDRLAYAARATSSFPGAFEPAAVRSGWNRTPGGVDLPPRDMAPVFSEIAPDDDDPPFLVIDGGVFDNIPIARAIEGVADAHATRRTRRILLYLDPDPPATVGARTPPRLFGDEGRRKMGSRFVGTTLLALKLKQTAESANDDLAEIRRRRSEALDLQARQRRFLSDMPLPAADGDPATEESLRRLRSDQDAERVAQLLVLPGVGFLRALVRPPVVCRGFTEREAAAFADGLRKELDGLPAPVDDPWALFAAASLMIAEVQAQQTPADPTYLADVKGRLYRVRTAALFFAQWRDRRAVEVVLGTAPSPPGGVADILRPQAGAGPLSGVLGQDGADDDAEERAFWAALAGIEDGMTDPFLAQQEALWARAAALFVELWGPAGEDPVSRLRHCAAAYAVATGSARSTSVPSFHTITGNQAVLDASKVPKVQVEGIAQRLDRLVAGEFPQDDELPARLRDVCTGVPDSESKLAGNQLANFAGFLAPTWRRHDWDWGRADGASGILALVDELEDPSTDDPGLSLVPPEEEVEEDPATAAPFVALLERLDRPKRRLRDLSADRRFALVSRSSLGVQRALWPLTPRAYRTREPSSGPTVPVLGALMLLRPVLVLLPLLLRPAALVLAVAAVLTAHHVSGDGEGAPRGTTVVLLAAVFVAAVLGLASTARSIARWRQVGRAVPEVPGADTVRLAARKVVAKLVLGALAQVLLVAGVAVTAWHVLGRNKLPDWASPADLAVVTAAALALSLAAARASAVDVVSSRPRRGSWYHVVPPWVAALAAVVLVLVHPDITGESWWEHAVDGAAAGVVVWLVLHAWAGWFRPPVCAVVVGLAATGVLALSESRTASRRGWLDPLDSPAADLVVPLAVLLLVFGAALLTKALGGFRAGPLELGLAAGGTLLAAVACAGVVAWYAAWPWLDVVPVSLALGAAAAAAVTLVVPFADELPPEPDA